MDLAERQELLDVALSAAREAGEVLLGHLGSLDPAAIGHKSHYRDLVTAADLEAERVLVQRLRAACADHAIEAEEQTRDALDGRPRWFLDPLDGTVNFVQRLPFFAVSMGLWVEGRPEVAVVHAPLLGETFSAVRGGGARARWAARRAGQPQGGPRGATCAAGGGPGASRWGRRWYGS